MGDQEISSSFKWFLLGAMILSGAANTIVYNAQNSSVSVIDGEQYHFTHPYMQALTMFIGEFSVITAFIFNSKLTAEKREKYEQDKEEQAALGKDVSFKKYLFLVIPASSDFFTSTLQYIALNYINPSVYQMLRGGVILVTALFSKVFLKRDIYNFMYIGCALVFVGIGLVGSSGFMFPEESNPDSASATAQGIAMGMIVVSLFFNGCLFVSEEWLLGKFFLHPFQVVGSEGFWGCVIYSIVLPILSTVRCPLTSMQTGCNVYPAVDTYASDKKDFYDNQYNQDHSTFESPALYFKQMSQSASLTVLVVLGVLTIAIFNVCGVNVTKHISSLTRSIADVSRTLLVWIISIIITATAGKNNDNYKWENLNGGAIAVELVGFAILIVGNFIYNGIIKLPFALPPNNEEEDEEQLLNKDVSMQPGADVYRKSTGRDSFHN